LNTEREREKGDKRIRSEMWGKEEERGGMPEKGKAQKERGNITR